MRNSMDNDFENFIKNIMEIEKRLNILHKESEKLIDNFINKITDINFRDKNLITNKYENLLIGITHELGSEMGFYREDIVNLNKYIHFRIKYNNFTEEIFEKILDKELTIMEKKELFTGNNKKMIEKIAEIKHEWNNTFNNISYKKFKEKLKLNE